MELKTSNKMIDVIIVSLFILVVIMSISFYIRGKQLSKLQEGFGVNNLAGKSKTEIGSEDSSSGKSLSQDEEESYKNKIKKLEIQASALQKLQDRLEKTLNEYDEKADSPASKQSIETTISYEFEDFIEENNYPPEVNKKLNDLYTGRQNAMNEYFKDVNNAGSKLNEQESMRRYDKIQSEFNKKLVDLLTEEGVAALKEYENTDMERFFIKDFQRMLGDDKLEKEKVKELVTLMHNERQAIIEEQRKTNDIKGSGPDKETMERRQMDNLERTKKIYEGYASLVEDYLSESQMQKFKGYVNMRKEILMSSNIIVSNNEKEKDEE